MLNVDLEYVSVETKRVQLQPVDNEMEAIGHDVVVEIKAIVNRFHAVTRADSNTVIWVDSEGRRYIEVNKGE